MSIFLKSLYQNLCKAYRISKVGKIESKIIMSKYNDFFYMTDVVNKIYTYMDQPTIVKMTSICKYFYSTIKFNNFVYHDNKLINFENNYFSELKKLSIGLYWITDGQEFNYNIQNINSLSRTVNEIYLCNVNKDLEIDFKKFNIEKLNIYSSKIKINTFMFNLKNLEISWCKYIIDLQYCVNIEYLTLFISELEYFPKNLLLCNKLKILKLCCDMRYLVNLPDSLNLEKLSLSNYKDHSSDYSTRLNNVDLPFDKFFKKYKKLKSLYLRAINIDCVLNDNLESLDLNLCNINFLNCPKLTKLMLRFSTILDYLNLKDNIIELELHSSTNIYYENFTKILKLSLTNISYDIPKTVINLKLHSIKKCDLSYCKNLEKIYLWGITNDVIFSNEDTQDNCIHLPECNKLKKLTMLHCNFGENSNSRSINNFENLESLNIRFSNIKYIGYHKNLRKLIFDKSKYIKFHPDLLKKKNLIIKN